MEKHDFIQEFPEYRDRILTLKLENRHFRKLFEEYQTLDNRINKFETGSEFCTDEYLNELRLKRVHIKDSLYKHLR